MYTQLKDNSGAGQPVHPFSFEVDIPVEVGK